METFVPIPESFFFLLSGSCRCRPWCKCDDCSGRIYEGFQHKFRADIDAQGHAQAIPLSRTKEWPKLQQELLAQSEVLAVSPYLQGPLLLQRQSYHSVPLSIGIDLSGGKSVLPLDEFLQSGQMRMEAHNAVDVTPAPNCIFAG